MYELRREKTGFLHMQKQRRRSASHNREADQRLCFPYIDSTIPLLPKYGGRTGLMVRALDSGSGDPGSILGRVGVFVSLSKRHLLPKSTGNTQE